MKGGQIINSVSHDHHGGAYESSFQSENSTGPGGMSVCGGLGEGADSSVGNGTKQVFKFLKRVFLII